jgi:hypothetical protein
MPQAEREKNVRLEQTQANFDERLRGNKFAVLICADGELSNSTCPHLDELSVPNGLLRLSRCDNAVAPAP